MSFRTKWKMYPMYDFACPVVDAHEGVTHALRTNEYRDRNPQYQWMLDALKLRKVHIWDFRYVFPFESPAMIWFDEGVLQSRRVRPHVPFKA